MLGDQRIGTQLWSADRIGKEAEPARESNRMKRLSLLARERRDHAPGTTRGETAPPL